MTDLKEIVLDQGTEDGFYSWESDTLNFAPNFVQWPDGELIQRADKDTYTYPVRGYYWFNSRRVALSFFKQKDPDVIPTLPGYGDIAPVQQFEDIPDPQITDNMGVLNTELVIDMPPAYADDIEREDPSRRGEEH